MISEGSLELKELFDKLILLRKVCTLFMFEANLKIARSARLAR